MAAQLRGARQFDPVLEDRYQALIPKYYETHKSPLPCTALSSSCFIDAYWNLFACSIWDEKVGNLRENDFDLASLWNSDRRKELRQEVVEERCSHCWTPCEAYPTILGNLGKAASLYEEAQRLGLNTIEVDPTMTVDELAGRVAEALEL